VNKDYHNIHPFKNRTPATFSNTPAILVNMNKFWYKKFIGPIISTE